MDAIGAHDQVSLEVAAVGKMRHGHIALLRDAGTHHVEAHAIRRDAATQDGVQVGTVHVPEISAEEARAHLTQRCAEKFACVLPIAAHHRLGQKADALQFVAQAECAQHFGGIGRHLHTGTDLTKSRGALEHVCLDAAQSQRARKGHATDAAADNTYSQSLGHDFSPSVRQTATSARYK